MTAEEAEAQEKKAVDKVKKRHQEERQRMQDERRQHEDTLAKEAAAALTELDKAMADLKPAERQQVRLHAYLTVLQDREWGSPNNTQEAVDQLTLRLVRYMTTGKV